MGNHGGVPSGRGKQDFRFVAHAGQFYTMKPKPMGGRGHEVIKNINRKEL
ncbi:MAG: hypothetical protein AMDU1_APLC00044G0004 [Thermoplasmatales archaeon A-plasma]|jgi:hypothetical protein|nr:MAG: hypothetical protein AMDU1_APLC00044G0004 [Thermoplasmatales archaeon A-plasma]